MVRFANAFCYGSDGLNTVKNTFDFRGFGYLENQLHTPKIKTSIEKHEFLPLKAKYVSESKGFNPLFSMRVK
jgi:hypothetical protein